MIPNIKDFIEVIVADGDGDMVVVASLIAEHLNIPMVWKRSYVKDHGKKKAYEGINDIKVLKGKKVMILSEFKEVNKL